MALRKYTKVVTVAASGTTSGEIDLSGVTLVGIFMPAAYTAGDITFTNSYSSGGTFATVKDATHTSLTVTAPGAGEFIILSDQATKGLWFTKIVCQNAQAAARDFTIVYLQETNN